MHVPCFHMQHADVFANQMQPLTTTAATVHYSENCECNSILNVFKTIHLNYAKTNFLPKDILNNLIYGIMFVLLNNIFIVVMCLHPGFIVFISCVNNQSFYFERFLCSYSFLL